tara:strand:+ start:425 stop:661 length:237 start_codon:yes stop_codon:yes gene_type:complete
MRVSVRVGDARVDLQGVDFSLREVRSLVRLLASIQVAIGAVGVEENVVSPPIGFTVVERAPDVEEDLSEWFEEEERSS